MHQRAGGIVRRLTRAGLVAALGGYVCLPASAANIFDDDWTPPPSTSQTVKPDVPAAPPMAAAGPDPKRADPQSVTPANVTPAEHAAPSQQLPSAADRAKSRAVMRQVYAADLKDVSPVGRALLAKKLLSEANNEKGSPTDQFVLLGGAIEAGQDARLLIVCCQAADQLATGFGADAVTIKLGAALKVLPKVTGRPAVTDAVASAVGVLDQLIEKERYTDASKLLSALRAPAANDPSLKATVQKKSQELQLRRGNYEHSIAALNQLKTSPDDAPANLVVGRYLCFEKGDWDGGLPYLAKGNDPKLKAVVDEDLASRDAASDARARVADHWWEVSTPLPDALKFSIQQHAALIYSKVAADLHGLPLKLAQDRMEEAASLPTDIAGGEIRKTYVFKDARSLDDFKTSGGVKVTAAHELELVKGGVVTKQKFRYPIRAEFEVLGKADNFVDMNPAIVVSEAGGFGVAYAWYRTQCQSVIFGQMAPLSADVPEPDRAYRIVLAIDRNRKARIEIDGKMIYEGILDAGGTLEGAVSLSGGNGHVVYRRCVVTAYPSTGS